MTIIDVLRHQWRRQVRSSSWGRSLIGSLLLVFAAGYFGLLFWAAGWFYPEIIGAMAPAQDPLPLLNEFLLYGAVGLVPMRFFLQRSAGSDVRPYLKLPLRRAQVVRVMQVLSSLSLLNLLPVIVLASLWGSTVLPATSAVGAACWAVGALLLVATTQFLNSLLRAVWDRNAGLVLGGAGLLVVVFAGSHWIGAGALRAVSAWLFEGLATGRILPVLVLGGVTVGTAVAAHGVLRTRLYDVLGDGSAGRGARMGSALLGRTWAQGGVSSLALLDLTLILRNKRPRQMLLLGLFVIAMFSQGSFAEESIDAFNKILFSFFLSGYLGLMYGQFGYAWHGDHFDRLLLHTASPVALVRAQFLTLAVLCVLPLLIAVPVAVAFAPSVLTYLSALLVYNLGVTIPALILVGTWHREAIELEQTAFFNYQGATSGSVLYGVLAVVVVTGLPLALALGLGASSTVLILAGLGAVGLATFPFWVRGLGRLLHRQRHTMAAGFRDE